MLAQWSVNKIVRGPTWFRGNFVRRADLECSEMSSHGLQDSTCERGRTVHSRKTEMRQLGERVCALPLFNASLADANGFAEPGRPYW
jgi:hypothetical protein